MKKSALLIVAVLIAGIAFSQKYPEPEFSNEVCYLKKDSINTIIRLEKGSSKMEAKTKMGGLGGYENGYELENERSTVRLKSGYDLSFVFSTGASATPASSEARDSMMKANGMDPSMMQGMGGMNSMNDPASTVTLYKVEPAKNKRKLLLQKTGGATVVPFSNKKPRSADKYTFSVKKVREGYWELVVDKFLPKGEYAFTFMGTAMGNMDGSVTIFSFGIE